MPGVRRQSLRLPFGQPPPFTQGRLGRGCAGAGKWGRAVCPLSQKSENFASSPGGRAEVTPHQSPAVTASPQGEALGAAAPVRVNGGGVCPIRGRAEGVLIPPIFPCACSTFCTFCRCRRGRGRWGRPWRRRYGQAASLPGTGWRQRCRSPWPHAGA